MPTENQLLEEIECLKNQIVTLFDAIAHGDQKHRDWLKAAIEAHFGLSDHKE